MRYVGRFAPSPTGPLHAGSLVAALASWLDARAAGGRWLVRIEDIDPPRCPAGATERILRQLAACQLLPDEPPLLQSQRDAHYQQALDDLVARGLVYPCACTRRDIDAALAARGLARQRHVERPYPGTCRAGLNGGTPRAWRLRTEEFQANQPSAGVNERPDAMFLITNAGVRWHDRRLGAQFQDVAAQVGDFVLRRADGLSSYQLAVVVDDAAQDITHVVRGEDLVDNTPRQILLQAALALPTPRYLHTPLVRGSDGEKLSKQHGAPAIDETRPLDALAAAARVLTLPAAPPDATPAQALALWARAWGETYNRAP